MDFHSGDENIPCKSPHHEIHFEAINRKSPVPSDNGGRYRLDEAILLRNPGLNHDIWDAAEIDQLEDYLFQCFSMQEIHGSNVNFRQNWVNCDMAIKYYNTNIKTQYVNFNESVPLKEAIRTGCAILASSELNDEEVELLMDLKGKGYFTVDGCDGDIKDNLDAGKAVSMSMRRYLMMKVHEDPSVRGTIEKNKHLLTLYHD